MNSLTTDWNNAANANETSFLASNGVVTTIPAGQADKVRSMKDAVAGGGWTQQTYVINTIAGDSVANAETVAALATVDVVVNVKNSNAANVQNVRVEAFSSDTTKFTVTATGLTDASGNVTLTITGVAAGEATLTARVAGSNTVAITPVTVTVT